VAIPVATSEAVLNAAALSVNPVEVIESKQKNKKVNLNDLLHSFLERFF
jgi:hypothetical protein